MKIGIRITLLLFLLTAAGSATTSWAQDMPGASRHAEASVFAAGTGTWTGYDGGQNLGITAGGDFGLRSFFGLQPSVELRGTYPIYKGHLNAYENFYGGVKVEKRIYRKYNMYADLLYGRAKITYNPPGRLNPAETILYQQTNTNTYSGGFGCDYALTPQYAFKADVQLQHYETPVTTTGIAWGKAISLGLVYRFGYGRHYIE